MRTCKLSSMVLAVAVIVSATAAMADNFGRGANAFTLDFVPILGSTNPTSGYGTVNNDYRMGTYEITNDQWDKFKASVGGTVTGSPATAYDSPFYAWGTNTTSVPTNSVSWYEAAQFVNYLNTSTNHHAAYKFTGTQGQTGYAFAPWSAAEAAGGTNLFRHKDAFYFLPTENEWVKAAYWNGTSLQTYATKTGESLAQGKGTGWNYYDSINGSATNPYGPWAVGSGSQELNGTYDMMGNVWEWIESPCTSSDYSTSSSRGLRGGSFFNLAYNLASPPRDYYNPPDEDGNVGFRVASVPEPGSIAMLVAGALAGLVWWRRKP